MPRDIYIAVDGPASSGKSATFSEVARRLKFAFIDTGLFYRAFCWSVLQENLPLQDGDKLADTLSRWSISFDPNGQHIYVTLEGRKYECSAHLHSHEIDSNVSIVAQHPKVREAMVKCQRKLAEQTKPCIVLGRDITSVVLTDAPVKIYLDSSVKVRADRRFAQLNKTGAKASYQEIYDALEARDNLDKNRPVGPLIQTKDSFYLNNDELTVEEAIALAVKTIEPHLA